jgi:hypothetical protein
VASTGWLRWLRVDSHDRVTTREQFSQDRHGKWRAAKKSKAKRQYFSRSRVSGDFDGRQRTRPTRLFGGNGELLGLGELAKNNVSLQR